MFNILNMGKGSTLISINPCQQSKMQFSSALDEAKMTTCINNTVKAFYNAWVGMKDRQVTSYTSYSYRCRNFDHILYLQ